MKNRQEPLLQVNFLYLIFTVVKSYKNISKLVLTRLTGSFKFFRRKQASWSKAGMNVTVGLTWMENKVVEGGGWCWGSGPGSRASPPCLPRPPPPPSPAADPLHPGPAGRSAGPHHSNWTQVTTVLCSLYSCTERCSPPTKLTRPGGNEANTKLDLGKHSKGSAGY